MTATTTTKTGIEISIDDELKTRLAAVAAEAGKSADAFVQDAIIASVEQAEDDAAFHKLGARALWRTRLSAERLCGAY